MKTPMQELIEQLKEQAQFITDDDCAQDKFYRTGLRNAIKYAESLLEKEEEVMNRQYCVHPCIAPHGFSLKDFQVEKALCSSRLPPEPEAGDLTAMQVLLRMPSGHRLERRFRNTDKLQVIQKKSPHECLTGKACCFPLFFHSLSMTLLTLMRVVSCRRHSHW